MTTSVGLKVSGAAELSATLRQLALAVRRRALTGILRVAAEPIRGRAAELAPIDPSTELDLKENMVISTATRIGSVAGGKWEAADENQAAVAVGPSKKVFYGLYQEYGTVRHAAHAFLRPAFDESADRSLTLIREGLWKLIDQAAKGAGVFAPSEPE